MALKIKTGTYTGTGAAKSITGLGFAMNGGSNTMLIIKGGSNIAQVGTSEMGSTKMQSITGSTPATGKLSSYDADGFTLGTDATVNANGTVYYYLAITDTTGASFKTGTYAGNATGPRGITGVGFQPTVLFTWDDLGDTGGFRTADMPTDSFLPWGTSSGLLTDRILSLDADGFTVSFRNETNGTGRNYYYAAFITTTSLVKNLSYTGNGTTAHAITGMGFQSDFVVSKDGSASTSNAAAMVSSSETTGNALLATASAEATGIFSSIDSDGFTLGTSANTNTNTDTYYAVGFKMSSSTVTTTKTQTGKARVTATTAQTNLGKSRITATTLQTIPGKARITATTAKTQPGLARITAAALKLQTGLARITATTIRTILGKAAIKRTTTQTQTGLARVTVTTPKTILGKSRITIVTPQVQLGKSRITAITARTQTGLARVTAATLRTILGRASLGSTTVKTQLGKSRITVTTLKAQLGKADIRATTSQTILGKARVALITLKAQLGLARLAIGQNRTQTGLARITAIVLRTQQGLAKIGSIALRTQLGKARITTISAQLILGNSRITVTRGGSPLLNGDFETTPSTNTAPTNTSGKWIDGTAAGSTTTSYGWAIPGAGLGASASAAFDTSVSHSGNASLRLSTANTSGTVVASTFRNNPPSAANLLAGEGFPIQPSTSYTITAWVKTNNTAANAVFVDFRRFSAAGAQLGTTSSLKLSGTNNWTQLIITVTVESTAAYGTILLRNGVAGNISDVWFDDIQVLGPNNQLGLSRILATTAQTALGISRITATALRTLTGLARLQRTVPQTIPGKSRIALVTPQAQPGKARVTAATLRTILGKADIRATTLRTIPGQSRLQLVTLRTVLGLARVSQTVLKTIQGISRITAITARTILGKASIISGSTTRTQLGKADIRVTSARTQTGVANIVRPYHHVQPRVAVEPMPARVATTAVVPRAAVEPSMARVAV